MATTSPTLPSGPRRMPLSSIQRGRVERPVRTLVYGLEGVGKTTFAASSPAPIFIGAEDGTGQLDVARFPSPSAWSDVLDAIDSLTVEKHDFKTLAVDSLDWAEPLLWDHVCQAGGKKDIEAFGYGKGYVAALDEWRVFLSRLDGLRSRGMAIVLLAHSSVKKFANPSGEDFDRYQLKLNEKAANLCKEWADTVLFASWEVLTRETDNGRTKGVQGSRVLYTTRTAAFDAKNRHGLPPTLPLDWAAYEASLKAGGNVAGLREEVDALLLQVPEDIAAKARAWLATPRAPHELHALREKLTAHASTTTTTTNGNGK